LQQNGTARIGAGERAVALQGLSASTPERSMIAQRDRLCDTETVFTTSLQRRWLVMPAAAM
jgi:hypothetical protein